VLQPVDINVGDSGDVDNDVVDGCGCCVICADGRRLKRDCGNGGDDRDGKGGRDDGGAGVCGGGGRFVAVC